MNVNSCLSMSVRARFCVLLGQLFLELRPFFFFLLPLTFRFKIVFWSTIVASITGK